MLERKTRFLTSRLRKRSGWKTAPARAALSVKEHLPRPRAVRLLATADPVLERRVVRVLGAAGGGEALQLELARPNVDAEEGLEERRRRVVPVQELREVAVEGPAAAREPRDPLGRLPGLAGDLLFDVLGARRLDVPLQQLAHDRRRLLVGHDEIAPAEADLAVV